MGCKLTNRIYLLLMVLLILVPSFASIVGIPSGLYDLVTYLLVFGIFLLLLKTPATGFFDVLPYNRGCRPVTALWTVLLVFLMIPVTEVLNDVVMLFVPDVLSGMMSSATRGSILSNFFRIAVIPAVFEEMFFRGIIYSGIRKSSGTVWALVLSSVLFGFFHMNFQQAFYAIFLGFILALLRELTGSMWTGMLFHFVNNGYDVVLRGFLNEESSIYKVLSFSGLSLTGSTANTVCTIAAAVICTALGALVIVQIAKAEGQYDRLKSFFRGEAGDGVAPVSVSLAVGFLLCLLLCLVVVMENGSLTIHL